MTVVAVLTVYRDRTNVVPVDLGADYTGDTFTAEIRVSRSPESTLIATWVVDDSDIANGNLTLTLDNSVTTAITAKKGYMDILRTSGGEPLTVFDEPLEVAFKDMPTDAP